MVTAGPDGNFCFGYVARHNAWTRDEHRPLIGCDVWVNRLVWKWGHEKKEKKRVSPFQQHDFSLDYNWKQSVR